MPSSPKIPKDVILKNALEMLIKDGYASITIKSLAEKNRVLHAAHFLALPGNGEFPCRPH